MRKNLVFAVVIVVSVIICVVVVGISSSIRLEFDFG
jgi:hypothetical protein